MAASSRSSLSSVISIIALIVFPPSFHRIIRLVLFELFTICRHPFVAFDQNFAVGGHARFGETLRISELQLYTDHLFDSVVVVVSVFRRKRSLWINARDDGFERPFRIRVEINSGRLTGAHTSDLAFGNEGPQIDLAKVDYRHDRRSGRDDFTRFG